MKKSFVLYTDYIEHINLLTIDQKGLLLEAIFNIALDKPVMEDLPPIVKMALSFIKLQMERDKVKYDSFIDKQKENGKKGGRPKGKAKPLDNNPNNPTVNLETQKSLTDTVTVTVTDNDNIKTISKDIVKSANEKGTKFYEKYFTDEYTAFARSLGFTEEDIAEHTTMFKEYYTVGKGKNQRSKEQNWKIRWKRWLEKERPSYARTGARQAGPHDAVLAGWSEAVGEE